MEGPVGWLLNKRAVTLLGINSCARLLGARTHDYNPLTRLGRRFASIESHENTPDKLGHFRGGPSGIRTHDTWLKRPLL
jgi:hypothetical protein